MNKMSITLRMLTVALLIFSAATAASAAPTQVDKNLMRYSRTQGVSGNLNSIGSDTLNNLMTLWSEKFGSFYPSVKLQIEGKGSSTAPPALIEGTAQLGPMSRAMKSTEMDAFEKKFGYKPTQLKVAVDALAVFVHKDNPIQGLTMQQLDAVFSRTRRQGHSKDIATWGELGLTGDWANRPISLYGRNSASGTYGFFKKIALKKGDYKNTVKEQPGSASVVQGITVDKYGIGYSGIGYLTSGVRAVPIKGKDNSSFVTANAENAYAGEYPLARFLYVYTNKTPGKSVNPLIREFFKLVLSKEGQKVVVKDGYFPLTASIAKEEIEKLTQ